MIEEAHPTPTPLFSWETFDKFVHFDLTFCLIRKREEYLYRLMAIYKSMYDFEALAI